MKTLIIAEKPDMGRNIAAAIEPRAVNKRTHLEGAQYVITWAIGHLIGLAEPDKYDEKYKKWNFQDLPIIPDTFKLLPNFKTKDQLQVIKTLAADCDAIVNACDAGREGQLIFAYIQQHLRLRQPVKRLWISDLTPETIRRGFETLKDGAEYDNLTRAARARSEADWLIGMNGSRAFTIKHRELLSVGRVQTPVLALVYDRTKQIEAFSSLKFYEVEAWFDQAGDGDAGKLTYKGLWQGDRITDPEKAAAIVDRVKGKPGHVAEFEVKDTREYPMKLYDLTLLQREANAKFSFSAKKTLDVAQALYEKHKVISYPRTNSNYVNEQNIPEMHRTLDSLRGTAYAELAQGADKRFVHVNNRSVCNPEKVEDHHAILPTGKRAATLSPDEQKLYDLVVKRFLSHFYPPAEYKIHTVITEVERERFKTIVKQVLSLGWKVVYAGDEDSGSGRGKRGGGKGRADKDGASGDAEGASAEGGAGGEAEELLVEAPFALDPNLPVLCTEAVSKDKETQPPKAYTEGTLLKAMESAGRQMEDEALRDAMKDSGLGTPATRASIIERLKQVGYLEMQGKRILITGKGRAAIELIRGAGVELLASPEMTGHWERRLNEISRGQASDVTFMDNVKKFTRSIVDKVRVQPQADKAAFEAASPAAAGRGRGRGSRAGADAGGAARSRGRAARGAGAASGDAAGDAAGGTAARAGTRRSAAAGAGSAAALRERVAACPRPGCGGDVIVGHKGYGCSRFREGCKFVIWKDAFGKSLTVAMARSLIEKGQTGKLKLTGRDGRPAEGKLVLRDPSTGTLSIESV
ncbi:DNA topoisomerase 3 [Paenibacillus sp. HJGM_3]|uniref:type IA DNA topoisomerase n=1 Tax=Paenibacillus sp. HJGM_3 TaxID=3379816 RepID=UPI00385D91D5